MMPMSGSSAIIDDNRDCGIRSWHTLRRGYAAADAALCVDDGHRTTSHAAIGRHRCGPCALQRGGRARWRTRGRHHRERHCRPGGPRHPAGRLGLRHVGATAARRSARPEWTHPFGARACLWQPVTERVSPPPDGRGSDVLVSTPGGAFPGGRGSNLVAPVVSWWIFQLGPAVRPTIGTPRRIESRASGLSSAARWAGRAGALHGTRCAAQSLPGRTACRSRQYGSRSTRGGRTRVATTD